MASLYAALLQSMEILLPKECLVCRRPLKRHYLCFRCTPVHSKLSTFTAGRCVRCFGPHSSPTESEIPCPTCITFPPLPQRIRFLWEYGGLPRDFIRTMKYRPSPKLTRLAGSWMAESLNDLFTSESWDIIAPIPSSPIAYRKRLFHPCAELARIVASSTPTATYEELLRHSSARSPQALRTHEERLRKIKGLFTCNRIQQVRGKRILLIEDVITTGATIAAAVAALHRAGAREVDVFAVAQTPVWRRFRSRIHSIFGDGVSSQMADD